MTTLTTADVGYQGRYRHACVNHPKRIAGCRDCMEANALYQRAADLDRMAGRVRTVDPTGSRRRLEGLAVTGWTGAVVAQRAGISHRAHSHVIAGDFDRIWTSRAVAIAALYDRIAGTPGPTRGAAKARTEALRRGWVHPDRWEGVDIDDPAAVPLPVEQPHASRARIPLEDVEHLVMRCGENWVQLAARFEVREDAVERALLRAGLSEVLEQLVRNSHGRWAA